jgi:hypothetical protein
MTTTTLQCTDSASIRGREDRYTIVRVDAKAVLKSWRDSLFSFEWLNQDGSIRSLDELPMHERDKRLKVEKHLSGGHTLERPVLGIGVMDNLEIGSGRDVFLTLAAHGVAEIEVHIPKSAAAEFKPFLR